MQKFIFKKALNYAIINKKRQYWDKNDQFLFYIRREERVGKSRVVKAIYLKFSFLKKQSKLLIVILTGIAIINIEGTTIHKALSINKHV